MTQTSGIGKVIFLAFQAYVDRRNRSPFAAWATILVKTGPEDRESHLRVELGLHLDLDAPLVLLLVRAGLQGLHGSLLNS